MKRLLIITLLVYVFCSMFTYAQADEMVELSKPVYLSTKCPAPMYNSAGDVIYIIPTHQVVLVHSLYRTNGGAVFAICGTKNYKGIIYSGLVRYSYLQ